MRKFPLLPLMLVLGALVIAAFILLPRPASQFMPGSVIDAPQSAMPIPEDVPDGADDVPPPALMGDVDEALNAAPSPDASLMPGAPSPVLHPLSEDRWVLSWLNNEAIPDSDRAPNIAFEVEAARVVGYAGCNRYSGAIDLEGDALSFGPVMATKMACDQLALESTYLSALDTVASWRITGNVLTFKDGQGADVARFAKP